jgi:hypothetical protein
MWRSELARRIYLTLKRLHRRKRFSVARKQQGMAVSGHSQNSSQQTFNRGDYYGTFDFLSPDIQP